MPSIHYFQNSDNSKIRFSYKPILFGIVSALIMSLILIFAASLILLYTNLSQQIIPILSRIIMFASVMIGGIVSGLKSNLSGWLYGVITGAGFFCTLWICSAVAGADISFTYFMPVMLFACIAVGCVGGVFGINLKPKRKIRGKH